MSADGSILEKIIQSKQLQEASQFDPTETINNLLKSLNAKERDILYRRFGLFDKDRETLEQIGKQYDITRERIRQIEHLTIRKIKEKADFDETISAAAHHIHHVLDHNGGIMERDHLLDELLTLIENTATNRKSCEFLLQHFLDEKVESVTTDDHFRSGWKLRSVPIESVRAFLGRLSEVLNEGRELLGTEDLLGIIAEKLSDEHIHHPILSRAASTQTLTEDEQQQLERVVAAALRVSQKIDRNILGQWGLNAWNTVSPKRMGDKVYLVLKKINKPLHFTEITTIVNDSGFDHKVAYPATVHNELILDDRFVLVGRGIYALKEWGYAPGTVIDIITTLLKDFPEGLTRDEIVEKVLAQRIVRKSTIYLALTNKDRIVRRDNGRYVLASA